MSGADPTKTLLHSYPQYYHAPKGSNPFTVT